MKKIIARALCHRYIGRLLASVFRDSIPHKGLRIYTGGGEVSPSTKAGLFWGLYEKAEIRFVRRYLAPDRDVIELGSSIGVVASHIAQRLEPGFRLICVEANPALLPYVHRNVLSNQSRVTPEILGRAIDYTQAPGNVATLVRGDLNTTSKLSLNPQADDDSVHVTTTTLADIVSENSLTRFSLVADIEGAEVGMFSVDASVRERCDQIIVELHDSQWQGRPVAVDEMKLGIEAMGFTEVARRGPVFVFERGLCRA